MSAHEGVIPTREEGGKIHFEWECQTSDWKGCGVILPRSGTDRSHFYRDADLYATNGGLIG